MQLKGPFSYHSNEPIQREGRSRIMGPIVEWWNLFMFPTVVPFFKEGPSTRVQHSNRLREKEPNQWSIRALSRLRSFGALVNVVIQKDITKLK